MSKSEFVGTAVTTTDNARQPRGEKTTIFYRILCRIGLHRMRIIWDRNDMFSAVCDKCGKEGVFRK